MRRWKGRDGVGEPGLGLDCLMSHLRGSSGEEKKKKKGKRECVGPTD
jgi:hypothetical protein